MTTEVAEKLAEGVSDVGVNETDDNFEHVSDGLTDFSELVTTIADKTRKHGDVIDRLNWLRRAPIVGVVALGGAGVIGFHESQLLLAFGTESAATIGQYTSTAIASATAGVSYATRPVTRFRQRFKASRRLWLNEQLADFFDGEPVEIYRQGRNRFSNELRVLWGGPEESQSLTSNGLLQRLTKLQELVQKSGARDVAVPRDQVKEFLHGTGLEDTRLTRDEWLRTTKKRKITDRIEGKDKVVCLTSEQLDTVIENARIATTEEPLHTIMMTLRKHKPDHPLLPHYFAGIKADPDHAGTFTNKLRRQLERHLDDVDGGVKPVADFDESFDDQDGASGPKFERVKHHMFGSPRIGSDGQLMLVSRSLIDYTHVQTSDLLRHMGITVKELERLPEIAQNLPKERLVQLCELAAWLTMHSRLDLGADESTERASKITLRHTNEVSQSEQRVGLQARIAERVIHKRRSKSPESDGFGIDLKQVRARRFGRTVATLALATGVGFGSGIATIGHLNGSFAETQAIRASENLSDETKERLINEVLSNPSFDVANFLQSLSYDLNEETIKQIAELLKDLDVEITAETEEQLQQWFEENTLTSGSRSSRAEVGNNVDAPNRPVWNLEAHGMETDGYWTEQVFNETSFFSPVWQDGLYGKELFLDYEPETDGDYDEYVERIREQLAYLPTPNDISSDDFPERIEVTRNILTGSGSLVEDGYRSYEQFGSDFFITDTPFVAVPVPMLDGARVVAGRFGDQPIQYFETENGSTVFVVPKSSALSSLEYWLAPAESSQIEAVTPITANRGDAQYPTNFHDEYWQEHIDIPADPNKRLAATASFLEVMEYDPYPLPDSAEVDDFGNYSFDSYIGGTLRRQTTNSHVAATTLALSNPELLNFSNGYINHSSPQQESIGTETLSLREQSSWTVDENGTIIDPTPPHSAPVEEFEELPKTPEQQQSERLKDYAMKAGLAGIALVAITQRRRLQALPALAQRTYRNGRLATITDKKASVAYDTLDAALFSGKKVDAGEFAKVRRLNTQHNSVKSAFKERFQNHDKQTRKDTYRQALKNTSSKSARRAIRRARRITKLVMSVDE